MQMKFFLDIPIQDMYNITSVKTRIVIIWWSILTRESIEEV